MDLRFTNVAEFELQLSKFAKSIDVEVEKVVRKVAFDVFRGVVSRTPVDTGWARASWNISFGTADLSVPSKPAGGETAAKALNGVQESKLNTAMAKFPVVWITNNLNYIQFLEAGHSKQSGKGFMVQRTMAEVFADLRNTLDRL